MKSILILLALTYSLSINAQISFTTDLIAFIDNTDTSYHETQSNIYLYTNSLTIQSLELGTTVFDLYAPINKKADDGTYYTIYSTSLGDFQEVRINLSNKIVLLTTKDNKQYIFISFNP